MQVLVTSDMEILRVVGEYPKDVSEAYEILRSVPATRPGSVWGLEGVAEYVAQQHGTFTLNKSGISKRAARALVKQRKASISYR